MTALLEALYHSDPATWLRHGRWGYVLVNASHILGIALLIGAITPLNLRLLGFWRSIAVDDLARVLVPVSVAGLTLAIVSGSLLFASRAPEYAAMELFLLKMGFVLIAVLHALRVHLSGWRRTQTQLRTIGLFSLLIWLSVLLCGRLLGFVYS